MKQKLKQLKYEQKITIFTFFFFLIIGFLSPLSGDDLSSYLIGKKGIIECFKNIDIKDGRIISGILVPFFSYHKIIFNFVFAFLISKFVSICNELQENIKSKYTFLHPLLGILLVSTFIVSYNYLSVTSTTTYTFPSIMFILYFYLLYKNKEINLKTTFLLLLISIYIILSSIHIGIVFLLANLVYFIIFNRKTKEKYSFVLVAIDIVLLIINMSLIENTLINTNINEILSNIPITIENIISKNIITIILGAIPINKYLYEKLKDKTYVRVVITLFDIILVFSLCYNFFSYVPFNLNLVLKKYSGIFATENWYYIFYYITYIVLFILSINYYIENKRLKEFMFILIISSIVLSLFSLGSYLFDIGNNIFIILSLIFIITIAINKAKLGIHVKIIKLSTLLLVIYYVSMFAVIKYIDITRNNYIEEQKKANLTNIEVKANPIYLVWRYNPIDYFQLKDFKSYFEIDENSTIEVKYFGVFEKIEKRVKE